MFVRKKKNKNGSVSIQIIDKSKGKYHVVKSLGSSKDPSKVERMTTEAYYLIPELKNQPTLNLLTDTDKIIDDFFKLAVATNFSLKLNEHCFNLLIKIMAKRMKKIRYTYWKDGDYFIGFLNDFPDYQTQAFSKEELIENLKELLTDIDSEKIPYIRKVEELVIE